MPALTRKLSFARQQNIGVYYDRVLSKEAKRELGFTAVVDIEL